MPWPVYNEHGAQIAESAGGYCNGQREGRLKTAEGMIPYGPICQQ